MRGRLAESPEQDIGDEMVGGAAVWLLYGCCMHTITAGNVEIGAMHLKSCILLPQFQRETEGNKVAASHAGQTLRGKKRETGKELGSSGSPNTAAR